MTELKPLVIYYSRSGRTERLARLIADDMHTEIIRVDPVRRYPSRYGAAFSRIAAEMMRRDKVPCNTPVPDLKAFNPVFVGFPVWMGDMPSFFRDFLARCGLNGKTVIPFSTSFSGSMGRAKMTMEKAAPSSDIVLPFDDGSMKGGDYRKWRRDVRKLIRKLEDDG